MGLGHSTCGFAALRRNGPPLRPSAGARPRAPKLRAGNGKLALCYHAVSEDWSATLSTTPALLRWQIARLLGRRYRPERFTDAVVGSGRRTLTVTFDDAFRSVHSLGFPILRELGVPASLFVPTSRVGGAPMRWPGIDEWSGGPHEPELVGCTWDEISELAEEGWEIGSHTCSHSRLTTLSDHEVRTELVDSKVEIEDRLGLQCRSLAYPYGDHDERVVRAAQAAGYLAAGTLPGRFETTAPLEYPRLFVSRADDKVRFAVKTAALTLAVRRSALWGLTSAGRAPIAG